MPLPHVAPCGGQGSHVVEFPVAKKLSVQEEHALAPALGAKAPRLQRAQRWPFPELNVPASLTTSSI